MAKIGATPPLGYEQHEPPGEVLAVIRAKAAEAKTLELDIAEKERALADAKAQLSAILSVQLPELCLAAGVPALTVESFGNLPTFKVKVVPYYKAAILAEWPEPKRNAAFEYLEDRGAADIIKTVVSVDFPKEDRETAKKLIEHLRRWGLPHSVQAAVNWATLTSWLKNEIEGPVKRGEATFPDLEIIGGTYGKVAKLTEVKDD
jgi:hypothetical protein